MKCIQAELVRMEGQPADKTQIYTMTWVPADLKLKVGDLLIDDAKRLWEAYKVYPLIAEEREGGSPWSRKSR